MPLHPKVDQALKKRQALKAIVGLSNFNVKDIVSKVQAAEIGGATYIDIAANVDIVQEIKKMSKIPICVSSIDIDELHQCSIAGADILELGNFDIFYGKNIQFTSKQIIGLTTELQTRVPDASICVTIPHSLHVHEQISLVKRLQNLRVAIIQTEGISSKCYSTNYLLNSIYNASAALSSTYVLSRYTTIPILTASGVNALISPIALAYGASGLGIGSFFNSANTTLDMLKRIQHVTHVIHDYQSVDIQLSNYYLKYSESNILDSNSLEYMSKFLSKY